MLKLRKPTSRAGCGVVLLAAATVISACSSSSDSSVDAIELNDEGMDLPMESETPDATSDAEDNNDADSSNGSNGSDRSNGSNGSNGSDESDESDLTDSDLSDTVAPQLVPAAGLATVDVNNQVSWAFNAVEEGLQLIVEPYVEMPLASNGRPARWNDLEFYGDRLFVVDEQDGKVFEITDAQAVLWFDIKTAIQNATGRALSTVNPFHGGVRGIAFHPDFDSNGKFYTSVMENRPADPSLHVYLSDDSNIDTDSVLIEWTADTSTFVIDESSYREVFRVGIPQNDHPIKQIAFNPAATQGDSDFGLLYIAHGDGSVESSTAGGGQANNALGKILRIDPLAAGDQSFSIPADNPFIDDDTLPDTVYSIGHRNPHHLAFSRSGLLLAAEAGRDNIDEVNVIEKGADYGWSEREGAFVHLAAGTIFDGIAALPENDALNGYVYPVVQYGHTGQVGESFVSQALGGGFVVENGSALDGAYFYIDFVQSGQIFHSSILDIQQATTRGMPDELTVAKSFAASVQFDHDNNADTPLLNNTLQEIVFSANGFDNVNNRVDVRIGQGPLGELYLMSKRNNWVYLISNSMP